MTALTLAALIATLLGVALVVGGRTVPAGATRDFFTWLGRAALLTAALLFFLRSR
jgi:hypothetical protein